MGCGGVSLPPQPMSADMPQSILEQAYNHERSGEPFVLATVVRAEKPTSARPGAKAIITGDGNLTGWVGGSCAQPTVVREALQAMRDGKPRLVRLSPPEKFGENPEEGVVEVPLTCISGGTLEIYLEPFPPKPRLVAIGHLPVVEALATLGKALGFCVTVMGLDADAERFHAADAVYDELDFAGLPAGPHTYIVVASHGNYDEEALEAALNTEAPYVALVSSRRRAEAVAQLLRESGLSEERLARLRSPAGLDIGAETPEEIALSILAEIVHLRRRPPPPSHTTLHLDQVEVGLAAGQEKPSMAEDPVCHMVVDISKARYQTVHDGKTYYFCALGCQRAFEKAPERYLKKE